MKRRKVKRVKAAKPKVDLLKKSVQRESRKAENLLDLDLGDLYSILGAQVKAVQDSLKLARAKVPRRVDKDMFYRQSVALLTELPSEAGQDFVKKYWGKLLGKACKWWSENRERYSGRALIANLALAIAPAIPIRLRAGSVLSLLAAILVKGELDKLCEERPELPPGIEVVEEKVEEVEKPAEEAEAVEAEAEERPAEEERPPEETPTYTF